jgi:hypothetical protein
LCYKEVGDIDNLENSGKQFQPEDSALGGFDMNIAAMPGAGFFS